MQRRQKLTNIGKFAQSNAIIIDFFEKYIKVNASRPQLIKRFKENNPDPDLSQWIVMFDSLTGAEQIIYINLLYSQHTGPIEYLKYFHANLKEIADRVKLFNSVYNALPPKHQSRFIDYYSRLGDKADENFLIELKKYMLKQPAYGENAIYTETVVQEFTDDQKEKFERFPKSSIHSTKFFQKYAKMTPKINKMIKFMNMKTSGRNIDENEFQDIDEDVANGYWKKYKSDKQTAKHMDNLKTVLEFIIQNKIHISEKSMYSPDDMAEETEPVQFPPLHITRIPQNHSFTMNTAFVRRGVENLSESKLTEYLRETQFRNPGPSRLLEISREVLTVTDERNAKKEELRKKLVEALLAERSRRELKQHGIEGKQTIYGPVDEEGIRNCIDATKRIWARLGYTQVLIKPSNTFAMPYAETEFQFTDDTEPGWYTPTDMFYVDYCRRKKREVGARLEMELGEDLAVMELAFIKNDKLFVPSSGAVQTASEAIKKCRDMIKGFEAMKQFSQLVGIAESADAEEYLGEVHRMTGVKNADPADQWRVAKPELVEGICKGSMHKNGAVSLVGEMGKSVLVRLAYIQRSRGLNASASLVPVTEALFKQLMESIKSGTDLDPSRTFFSSSVSALTAERRRAFINYITAKLIDRFGSDQKDRFEMVIENLIDQNKTVEKTLQELVWRLEFVLHPPLNAYARTINIRVDSRNLLVSDYFKLSKQQYFPEVYTASQQEIAQFETKFEKLTKMRLSNIKSELWKSLTVTGRRLGGQNVEFLNKMDVLDAPSKQNVCSNNWEGELNRAKHTVFVEEDEKTHHWCFTLSELLEKFANDDTINQYTNKKFPNYFVQNTLRQVIYSMENYKEQNPVPEYNNYIIVELEYPPVSYGTRELLDRFLNDDFKMDEETYFSADFTSKVLSLRGLYYPEKYKANPRPEFRNKMPDKIEYTEKRKKVYFLKTLYKTLEDGVFKYPNENSQIPDDTIYEVLLRHGLNSSTDYMQEAFNSPDNNPIRSGLVTIFSRKPDLSFSKFLKYIKEKQLWRVGDHYEHASLDDEMRLKEHKEHILPAPKKSSHFKSLFEMLQNEETLWLREQTQNSPNFKAPKPSSLYIDDMVGESPISPRVVEEDKVVQGPAKESAYSQYVNALLSKVPRPTINTSQNDAELDEDAELKVDAESSFSREAVSVKLFEELKDLSVGELEAQLEDAIETAAAKYKYTHKKVNQSGANKILDDLLEIRARGNTLDLRIFTNTARTISKMLDETPDGETVDRKKLKKSLQKNVFVDIAGYADIAQDHFQRMVNLLENSYGLLSKSAPKESAANALTYLKAKIAVLTEDVKRENESRNKVKKTSKKYVILTQLIGIKAFLAEKEFEEARNAKQWEDLLAEELEVHEEKVPEEKVPEKTDADKEAEITQHILDMMSKRCQKCNKHVESEYNNPSISPNVEFCKCATGKPDKKRMREEAQKIADELKSLGKSEIKQLYEIELGVKPKKLSLNDMRTAIVRARLNQNVKTGECASCGEKKPVKFSSGILGPNGAQMQNFCSGSCLEKAEKNNKPVDDSFMDQVDEALQDGVPAVEFLDEETGQWEAQDESENDDGDYGDEYEEDEDDNIFQ